MYGQASRGCSTGSQLFFFIKINGIVMHDNSITVC